MEATILKFCIGPKIPLCEREQKGFLDLREFFFFWSLRVTAADRQTAAVQYVSDEEWAWRGREELMHFLWMHTDDGAGHLSFANIHVQVL